MIGSIIITRLVQSKKIIFIFPTFNGPYGGERHCLRLADELTRQGNEVEIWTHYFNVSCRPLLSANVKLKTMTWGLPRIHSLAVIAALFRMPRLAHLLKQRKNIADALIVAMGWQSAYALTSLQDTGARLVYYCLEPPRFLYDLKKMGSLTTRLSNYIVSPMIRRIDLRSVRAIKTIFTNSPETQTAITSIYGRESQVVYPGIEKDRFKKYTKSQAKEKLGLAPNTRLYLSAGKLHRRKRIDAAIDYFLTQPQGTLYIIGDGPDRNRLVSYAKEKDRSGQRIRFLGQCSDDVVALHFQAADYFVFMAKDEPFGLVIAEAKAAGCHIVPHDIHRPSLSWSESAQTFMTALI
ncbi:MAG: glycosyltransferase [Patescibacteria group bacterium]